MSFKKVEIPGVGSVTLIKHARSRSLRLTVTSSGVRVSMPRWSPYKAGVAFAAKNQAWIRQEQLLRRRPLLVQGQAIGKRHYLKFVHIFGQKTQKSRVGKQEIAVFLSAGEAESDENIQTAAMQAVCRALKSEARELLPPRIESFAKQHGFTYGQIAVKELKRRWGSCSSQKHLTFNCYLMGLPWELIDYVILHELTHTEHLHHGPDFWRAMERVLPETQSLRRQLRSHQPALS